MDAASLPHEVLSHVLSFLDVASLCRASQVSRAWYHLASADSLWRSLCVARWATKPGARLGTDVFFRANLAHPAAVASLTIHEMRLILRRRKVNEVFFEKTDMQNAVVRSTPEGAYACPIPSKWKASYVAAEIDSKRTQITFEELTAHKWLVYFRTQDNGFVLAFSARFDPDFNYHSDDGNSFPWRFYGPRNQIQVGEFPAIWGSRSPRDWSWRLQNEFAKLVPIDRDVSGED